MGGDTFLQQFMAGWQMGQQRREGQRRDQMMMQQQQQEAQRMQADAQERAARIEALKLQKDRIEWERKREEFDAKLNAAAMTSAQTQVLPPQTEDLGEGTQMEMGPMTAPTPPIMVDVPGGGQIQAPFYEDIQARKDHERQQKILEALGMKTAEAQAMQPFKEAEFQREAGLRRELAGQKTRQMQALMGAFGTAKTEGQQNKVEVAQYALSQMPKWQKFINENEDKFGFWAGRKTKAIQSGALEPLGMKADPKTAQFTSSLGVVVNAMLNALSGAAISPQEYERMKEQVPLLTDPPDVVRAKMGTLDDYFKFRLKNFNAPYQGPGWQAEPPPPGQATPPPAGVNPLLVQYGVEIYGGDE